MTDYVVTLTETEQKAMEFVAADANDWIQHAIHERARLAIEEIVQIAIQNFLQVGEPIPGSKDDIVAAAYTRGWVKSAAQRNEDFIASMPKPQI